MTRKGFTLLEAIVTIAIMAVIAAILVPGVLTYIETGREKQDELRASELVENIQEALTYQDAFREMASLANDEGQVILEFPTTKVGKGYVYDINNAMLYQYYRHFNDTKTFSYVNTLSDGEIPVMSQQYREKSLFLTIQFPYNKKNGEIVQGQITIIKEYLDHS